MEIPTKESQEYSYSAEEDQASSFKKDSFIPFPVWTPQSSPCMKRKEFRPVQFQVVKPGNSRKQVTIQSDVDLPYSTVQTDYKEKERHSLSSSLPDLAPEPSSNFVKIKISRTLPEHIWPSRHIKSDHCDIEEYTPGGSSILKPKSSLKKEIKDKSIGQGNLSRILCESNAGGPKTIVQKREPNAEISELNSLEKRQKYLKLQHGGDPPFHGFRTTLQEACKDSSKKYVKSNVNIHYNAPVLLEEKEDIPENVLVTQQANHMIKFYKDESKKKMLKEKLDNEKRRHTDNFTVLQKAPVLLNRYDNVEWKSTYANIGKAFFDFQGNNERELSFKKGDILIIQRKVDEHWYEGEIGGRKGLVPSNYIEVLSYGNPSTKVNMVAVVKYDFPSQTTVELALKKGETVFIKRRVDQNWYEGEIGNRRGIFPVSYVEVHDRNKTTKLMKELCIDASQDISTYEVVYPYKPQNEDELELIEGGIVHVFEKCDDGWFVGSCGDNFGTFPGNYVRKIIPKKNTKN